MKKLGLIAAAAALLIGAVFASCTTEYDKDYDYANPVAYLVGDGVGSDNSGNPHLQISGADIKGWGDGIGQYKLVYDPSSGFCVIEHVTIPAGSQWKTVLTTGWAGACTKLTDDCATFAIEVADGNGGQNLEQVTTGTYTIKYQPDDKTLTLVAE